jgi:hypothetical protein
MWSRRSVLVGFGVSVSSLTVAGKLGSRRSASTNPYLADITIESLAGNVDADDRDERLVWVRFVPKRRLVAVRLEARVADAHDVELARSLDSDGDGWYVIARRMRLGHEHRGTEQYLRAPESRQLPDVDERWVLRSRGYQPETVNGDDFRGFRTDDVLRVVAVPYGGDPVVVAEHVVGENEE